MSREVHVRFWESAAVKSRRATQLPLYRQSEIYEREGLDLSRSTLADWVGGAAELLSPLAASIGRYVMGAQKLHGDDTPVPVLCPGRGTTKSGSTSPSIRSPPNSASSPRSESGT